MGPVHAQPLQRLIQPLSNDRDPGRRLRVGYVAAEFWTHSVSFFFVPLLRNHDRGNFEIFCFSNVERTTKSPPSFAAPSTAGTRSGGSPTTAWPI